MNSHDAPSGTLAHLADVHRGWCNYCKGNVEWCRAAPPGGCSLRDYENALASVSEIEPKPAAEGTPNVPPYEPPVGRHCACRFSSGGVLSKSCEFHTRISNARLSALEADAQRYQELCVNPVGGAHLLNLLAAGKGDQKSLDSMIDRVRASRLAAIQKGIDAARTGVPNEC